MIRAVVFDLDGTLASFNVDYKTIRAEVKDFLVKRSMPASVLSLNESIFEMLKKTEIFMKNNGKSTKAVSEIRNKALAIAEKYELEAARNTSSLPGAFETLKELRAKKLKIGLCTINGERSTSYILKRFKLDQFIDAVVTREKVKFVKPNPEQLEAILKELDVDAGEAVVVGDSEVDMKCASELKIIAVGLTTAVTAWRDLVAAGANYIVTSLMDVPMLVKSFT